MRKFLHKYIIRFIAWYIRDMCGGASHVYPYGEQGRYIVIMNEDKYNKFTHLWVHKIAEDVMINIKREMQCHG